MNTNAQDALAALALVLMGALAGALIFVPVPPPNQQLVTFALGAISGAMTIGGVGKAVKAAGAPIDGEASSPATMPAEPPAA